jgi:hypothetical protein
VSLVGSGYISWREGLDVFLGVEPSVSASPECFSLCLRFLFCGASWSVVPTISVAFVTPSDLCFLFRCGGAMVFKSCLSIGAVVMTLGSFTFEFCLRTHLVDPQIILLVVYVSLSSVPFLQWLPQHHYTVNYYWQPGHYRALQFQWNFGAALCCMLRN